MIPGEYHHPTGNIPLNPDRDRIVVRVINTADRPVQVGSHYHFAAANPGLEFDRESAWGMRLDVPAGTAIRFEPGIERDVPLVPLMGNRVIPGLRPEWSGPLDNPHGPPANPRGPLANPSGQLHGLQTPPKDPHQPLHDPQEPLLDPQELHDAPRGPRDDLQGRFDG